MLRVRWIATLIVCLILPASASAGQVVIPAGEHYRIPGCYIANGKNVGFGTGASYGQTPIPVTDYEPASDGWTATYALEPTWHARAASYNPTEGPLYLAIKTVAYNDGPGTVVFHWTGC